MASARVTRNDSKSSSRVDSWQLPGTSSTLGGGVKSSTGYFMFYSEFQWSFIDVDTPARSASYAVGRDFVCHAATGIDGEAITAVQATVQRRLRRFTTTTWRQKLPFGRSGGWSYYVFEHLLVLVLQSCVAKV